MKNVNLLITTAILTTMSVTSVMARPSLSDDARITNELIVAAVGEEIRNNCPTIAVRRMKTMMKAYALRDYAVSLGYSMDEITDFIKNKEERARIFALRDQYLTKNSVVKGDSESYCRLGEKEIAEGSLLGSLLIKN